MNARPRFRLQLAVAACLSFLFVSSSARLFGQQPKEPDYENQFFAVGAHGDLLPLEQKNLKYEQKTHRGFGGSSFDVKVTVSGDTSPIVVPAGSRFVIKMTFINGDPANQLSLDPLTAKKEERSMIAQKTSANAFTGNVKYAASSDNSISLTFKKYGKDVVELIPAQPLPPGEYMLSTSKQQGASVYCFKVE